MLIGRLESLDCQFISTGVEENLRFLGEKIDCCHRTQFQHQDNLVPWKLKGGEEEEEKVDLLNNQTMKRLQSFYPFFTLATQVFLRYYHVFEEGELESLVEKVEKLIVVESYYDQGNWCSVVEKV